MRVGGGRAYARRLIGRTRTIAARPGLLRLGLALAVAVAAFPAPAGAAFPGANGRIAYGKDRLHCCAADLFSVQADGLGEAQIATSPGPEYEQPAYSANGQLIAFASVDYINDVFGIYTINSDGSGMTFVTAGGAPSFSPDGTRIVFTRGNLGVVRRNRVFTANVDGSGVTPLTRRYVWSDPVFSPDGTKVAVGSSRDIAIMSATGGRVTNLTRRFHDNRPPFFAHFSDPDFSPDGRWIVCSGSPGGERDDIYLVRTNGSRLVRVTHTRTETFLTNPVFSPDGRQIAFQSDAGRGIGRVMVMNRDGSAKRMVASQPVRNGQGGLAAGLSWQPIVP